MIDDASRLEVRDVTVRVRARTLLHGVSFDAAPAEVVAVIGPNGAGKTTLLEVVTGLRAPERGTTAFRGAPLRSFGDRARTFAFLPDDSELPAELRVRDVVEHALSSGPRAPVVVGELRGTFGIAELNEAPSGVLSRGERARVSLFCALAVDRPVIVLDEPFSAFDPLKLRDVLAAVRRIADSGAAVVATIHHLSDAARIADRLMLLAEGRVIASGNLASLQSAAGVPGGTLEDIFVTLLSRRNDAA